MKLWEHKRVENMEEILYMYYTSDLHSHFENWPKINHYLKHRFNEHQHKNEQYFLLDNGDHLDRVNPMSEATLGKINVDLLNQSNYDVVTLGNNEGITLDRGDLFHLYDDAKFDVVCANLESQDDVSPSWLKRYKMITTKSGVNIAVIGLTAPFNNFYHPMGWHALDPLKVLKLTLTEVRPKADVIILLSHLGVDQDEIIADHFREIDIIIGGHTHHLFKEGERINNSVLTAVGKFGHYVGQIRLYFDHEKGRLINKEANAVDIDADSLDRETVALLDDYQVKTAALLNQTVCYLNEELEVNWFKETPVIKQLTETLRSWTDADVAMLNAGILIESLPAGPVTLADLHRICPHPINPCVVNIKGSALIEVIRAGLTETYTHYPVTGYGFRGKVMGKLIYDGIEVELKDEQANEPLIRSIYINGKAIDRKKSYRLATADMFTFGHLAPQIARAKEKRFFMPEFMRDLLRVMLATDSEKDLD